MKWNKQEKASGICPEFPGWKLPEAISVRTQNFDIRETISRISERVEKNIYGEYIYGTDPLEHSNGEEIFALR